MYKLVKGSRAQYTFYHLGQPCSPCDIRIAWELIGNSDSWLHQSLKQRLWGWGWQSVFYRAFWDMQKLENHCTIAKTSLRTFKLALEEWRGISQVEAKAGRYEIAQCPRQGIVVGSDGSPGRMVGEWAGAAAGSIFCARLCSWHPVMKGRATVAITRRQGRMIYKESCLTYY